MEALELRSDEGILIRTPLTIRVISGTAEIWGAPFEELSLDEEGMEVLVTSGSYAKLEISRSDYVKINNPIPSWWEDLLDKILDKITIFIGRTDSGKSSSILYLSNKALLRGEKVSVVDSDVGQSDLGPPGVISSANLKAPVYQMKCLEPDFMYFVGDKSPRGHLLQMCLGIREALRNVDGKTVLINTTGFVDGAAARILKRAKVELVEPDIVILIEKQEGDLGHLMRSIPKGPQIIRVRSHVRDLIKDRDYRNLSRKASLRRFLKGGMTELFDINELSLENTFLLTGIEKTEYASFLGDILGSKVVWVEESSDMLLILTEGHVERIKIRKLEDLLRKEVRWASLRDYENLYIGLKLRGKCMGIGILKSLDLKNRKASIFTRYRGEVDSLSLGFFKLDEEGNELGSREVDSP